MKPNSINHGDTVTVGGMKTHFEVACVEKFPHGMMVGIYDEPPSKHVDFWKIGSVKLVRRSLKVKSLEKLINIVDNLDEDMSTTPRKKTGAPRKTPVSDFIPVFVASPKATAKRYGVNERTANRWIKEWKEKNVTPTTQTNEPS